MSAVINDELKQIIADSDTVKTLASLGKDGSVHIAVKESLFVDENGQVVYLEFFEKSQTNKNLVYAIWFEKSVAINILSKDKRSFIIKGKPYKSLVHGSEYERYYREADAADSENDLVAVYYIDPTEVYEQTFAVRRAEEKAKHPLYVHLDKLAK
jgi:hypothetical protein